MDLQPPSQELLRELADRFVSACREDIRTAHEWVSAGTFDPLVRLGHQIKGTGPTLGFAEVGTAGARPGGRARRAR